VGSGLLGQHIHIYQAHVEPGILDLMPVCISLEQKWRKQYTYSVFASRSLTERVEDFYEYLFNYFLIVVIFIFCTGEGGQKTGDSGNQDMFAIVVGVKVYFVDKKRDPRS
jgi:hypothetical protein